jgi:hypothetical protein
LIHDGYPPDFVWKLTPRQLAGYLEFGNRRRSREHAELLGLSALAASGDYPKIRDQVRKLEDQAQ